MPQKQSMEWTVAPELAADVPWNRQPGEPLRWFASFEYFRLMGNQRNLEGAWRREQADKGRAFDPGVHRCPQNYRAAAVEWQWQQRAEAWDYAEVVRKRRDEAEAASQSRAERIDLLNRAMERLEQALYVANPALMKMGEVVNAIRMVVTELRSEYGQQPAGQFALTEEEADVAIDRALAELSARNQDAVAGELAN